MNPKLRRGWGTEGVLEGRPTAAETSRRARKPEQRRRMAEVLRDLHRLDGPRTPS